MSHKLNWSKIDEAQLFGNPERLAVVDKMCRMELIGEGGDPYVVAKLKALQKAEWKGGVNRKASGQYSSPSTISPSTSLGIRDSMAKSIKLIYRVGCNG